MRDAVIPFDGFYDSVSMDNIDHAHENMLNDDSGDVADNVSPEDAEYFFNQGLDTRKAMQEYAKLYARNFLDQLLWKDHDCAFDELVSPREYNFTTDRIFVKVPEGTVKEMFRGVYKDTLTAVCKERHTSRSGFHSFYDPDWTTWGPVETWEPEQLCSLFHALVSDEWSDGWQYEVVDDSNNEITNIVYDCLTDRAKKIVDAVSAYLNDHGQEKEQA